MDLNADVSEALFFTGDGDVDALGRLLDALRSVRTTLDVCVFTITDDRIVRVLKRLHRKGVAVRVITDNDTSVATGSDIGDLREDGIEVRTDDNEFHMHHKVRAAAALLVTLAIVGPLCCAGALGGKAISSRRQHV